MGGWHVISLDDFPIGLLSYQLSYPTCITVFSYLYKGKINGHEKQALLM